MEKRQVSFRCNTLKSTTQEVETALEKALIRYIKLDFPKNCYLIDRSFSESDLWRLDIYKQGKIYIQSISSQVPVHFFSQKSPLRILDACAAPGWKSSQLSELYPDAEIYAFEPFKVRYDKMKYNLNKLWCENIHTIHDEIRNISKYISEENFFDIILVDAPCSSEWSLLYNNTKFLEAWNISHIQKNYKRQKHIIDDVLPYLKVGWEIIYSTCTIAPEENEWIVHYILCHSPQLELQKLDFKNNIYIKYIEALKKFEKYIYKTEISEKALRVIPSEYSEWFFIAKFKKWHLLK